MSSLNTILLSLVGGVLPALIWLWFWLKEDCLHPEPKSRIIIAFLGGMAAVFVVLPIEKFIFSNSLTGITITTVFMWAGIEEIVKYLSAYFTSLRNKEMNEPVDAIIYMITVALGFSALENSLFIFNLIDSGSFLQSVTTGNSRFLGATLLHVASSAIIGIMIGLSYYKKYLTKRTFLLTGIVLSILLHTLFNLLIIKASNNLFLVFSGVWILIVLIIVLFEKVKKIRY
ncbi:MAG: PrsW family intramembrane metalloprotease [Candidatus Zambryskibacteria bacterium]|nr:PrsW family intramembrane metalloprotease [Candidatus Zambryskibacteria bacterium]